jgi:integrase
MASIKPYGDGEWRAQIARRGVRDSQVFTSKGAAVAWAGNRESEIMAGVRGEVPNLTVAALFERYEREVSKWKKGERWERIRLQALGRDRLAQVRLRQLDTPHVADWQQRWLERMKAASVRRERNLLNNVFEIARKEWKWLHKNPFVGVRRPKDGKPRDRVATDAEVAWLTEHASANLRRAIITALETAMRAGDIASKPAINGRTAKLPDSKNGEGRIVPLSGKALEQFQNGIGLTAGSISAEFAKLCKRPGAPKNLTFHDLKHTAMTRLSKKLDPWELAKMTGNKDMNLILRVYYKMDPEDVARKL